jgi:dipeptidyl aminopeptidase/acylaminoacyl peptidase
MNARDFVFTVLAGSLLAGAAARAEAPPPAAVPVPDSIVAKNVPPVPRQDVADLLPYENIRTAGFADWHPRERRMLITTRFADSVQIHEVAAPMGARTQLTFYRDPVPNGSYRPNRPDELLYTLNEGGAENFQFFLLDRRTGKSRRLTDGVHRYTSPRWSHGGRLLAYASNVRNGRDFDVYVADPAAPGSERKVAECRGTWSIADWSPDDRRLLLHEFVSANEAYLHWVDVAGGAVHALTPKRPGPLVAYEDGQWGKDGRSIYTVTDRDSDFLRLVRFDPESGAVTPLSGDIPWDVDGFDLSDDGSRLAFFVNEDGVSKLHLLDLRTGAALPAPELPPGVARGLSFRPGSHEIAFALSWAHSPSDVYSYDLEAGRLERWTASEAGGLDAESFVVPQLVHYPTFDSDEHGARRTIPAFVYRPPADRFPGPRPVYVSVHGGPEDQAQPVFLGSANYYLNELGVAMIYPNVRGSSGYGKRYLLLDNGMKREDSIKDLGALLDWIKTQPDLDASRVLVGGGSYGGYMTLAALTHYSDRLRAGFSTVGISNFITYLKNTQSYRQDLRRAEYGDERDPRMRAFLETVSPINQADRITVPMLVAQGANDPRVPLSESDQIVAAVAQRGVPVWYVVGRDEGHGFQKKSNADYLRAVLVEFMKRYLLAPGGPSAAARSGE